MYKTQRSRKWISIDSVENNRIVILNDLMPSTTYDLKITAFNEAGSTEAQYSFVTLSIPSQGNVYIDYFNCNYIYCYFVLQMIK